MTAQTKQIYEFGPFYLDTVERVLRREGRPVSLPPKAFDVLLMLVESSGHIVEKDALMNRVWADSFVEEGNLKVTVSVLRKALEQGADDRQYIETVPRRGYRFVADVKESPGNDIQIVVREQITSSLTIEEKDGDEKQREDHRLAVVNRKKRVIARVALGFLAAAGLVVTGYYLWTNRLEPNHPVKSIAVLPFKPLVPESRDESLELGMAETLITRLSKLRQIMVRPISAVSKYAAPQQDALAVGRELKTEAVLDGSIQKLGDRIRVTVRLLNTNDGRLIWAAQFDEKTADIFKVQDSIAERVANGLAVKMTEDERQRVTKHSTENAAAYELYAKGRAYLYQHNEDSGFKALECFSQALALDPNYAPAYSGLSDVYNLASDNFLAPTVALPKAKAYAEKALAADESLDEAHLSMAQVRWWGDWDRQGTEAEFKRALELNPGNPLTHLEYGRFLTQQSRFDEAIGQIKIAQEIDPLSARTRYESGWTYYCARQYDRAIDWYKEALSIDMNSAQTHRRMGLADAQKGMLKEAVAEIGKALEIKEDAAYESDLGWLYATAGRKSEVQNALKKLQALARRKYVSPYYVARIYAGLGDKERLYPLLEQAYKDHSDRLMDLQNDPVFDPFRTDPQYSDLIHRIGFAL